MEELMRKFIVTMAAGLLLTAGVDAAAAKPKPIEGRAAYQASHSHLRGNDFGPGFESPQPVPNKAMRMKMAPAPSAQIGAD
jgi:hypothetical protein